MANFNDIKHEIDQNVNTNGVQAITGAILNETLKDMIDEVDEKKQDTLVAGQNITISGNVISATGGGGGQEYYEGRAIDIDSSNRINVVPSELPFYLAGRGLNSVGGTLAVDYDSIPSEIAGNGLRDDGNGHLEVNPSELAGDGLDVDPTGKLAVDTTNLQEKLQAGANIQISGNTISATDTTYSAGQGLQQNGNVFSVKAGSGLGFDANGNLINTGGGGGGATYTAGSGIDISQNNVISAKTGPGLLVDPSTNNIELDRSALNFLPLEGGQLQATTPGNDTTLTVMDGMNEDYVRIVAPETAGEKPHVEIFENGSGDTKFYYDHLERGTQTTINYPTQSGTLALTSDIPYAPVYSGGNAIDIDASTNAISVNYSGGGLYLDGNNQLAVDYTSIPSEIAGNGLQDDGNGHLEVDTSVVQEKLVAGQNITISGNVISASGGSGGNYLPLDGGTLQNTTGRDNTSLHLSAPNGSPAASINQMSSNYGYGNITIGAAQTDQTVIQNDLVQVHNATSGKTLEITSEGFSDGSVYHASLPTLTQDEILATQSDVNTAVSGKQDLLTAGSGISIVNNVISATGGGGNYLPLEGGDLQANSAQNNTTLRILDPDTYYSNVIIDANKNGDAVVQINTTSGTTEYRHGEIMSGSDTYTFPSSSGTIALTSDLAGKQDILTAGTGISIQGNVISATGGGGSGLWTSGTGTGSVMSPGAFQANGNNSVSAGDYTRSNGTSSIALGTSTTTTGLSAAAIGANSTAAGSYSVALGHGLGAVNTDETALGKFNNYIDTGTTAEKTFFTVGNGTSNNTKSNIIEIKQNNDAFLVGIGGFDGTNASQALSLQTVINSKQNQLVSGVDIKTINGQSIVGGGDLVISGGSSYTAGSGISIDSNNVITNTAPDPGVLVAGAGNKSLKLDALSTSADGAYSIALGAQSHANGTYSFAAGQWASASRNNSIAIGDNATSAADYALGVGQFSNASGVGSVALGQYGEAKNTDEIGLGKYNNSINTGTTAEKTQFTVGNGTAYNSRSNLIEAKQNNDIYVLGIGGFDGTNASQALSLQTVINSKQNQLVSGVDIKTINGQSIVGGGNLVISGGSGLWTSGTGQNSLVSPGADASSQGSDASGIGAIVIGEDSNANGDYSFAHGQGTMANGDYSAAFISSNTTGDYSFAAGQGADAQAAYSVAIGTSATAVFDNSDPNATINAESSIAIGGTTYGMNAVAIGANSTASGQGSVAFGDTSEASGSYSIAGGNGSHANGMYSTAFAGSTSDANYSFAASTGYAHAHYSTALSGAEAFGEGAFAAGQGNQAYGYGAAALGYMAQTYTQADGTDVSDPNAGEVALGRYNYSEQGIVFTVGCGYLDETDPDNPQEVRQNAVAIDSTGKIFLKGLGGYTGTSTSGCTDLVSFLNNL